MMTLAYDRVMMRRSSIGLLALLLLALAGCGASTAEKIAAGPMKQYNASEVSCTIEGTALFPDGGGRWKIYDCLISGADPDVLYYEHIRSSPFRRCYVYDGQPVDATKFLHHLASSRKAYTHLRDLFACLGEVASASS
jgi:hypothetical protein